MNSESIKEAFEKLGIRIIDFISKLFSVKILLFFIPFLIAAFRGLVEWWLVAVVGCVVFFTREVYKYLMKYGLPKMPVI
jgi:hypothetical protein